MNPNTEEEFYYKLDNMVLSSCQKLREIFKLRYQSVTGSVWVDDNTAAQEDDTKLKKSLKGNQGKDNKKGKKTFPEKPIQEWDMTRLNQKIQNLGDKSTFQVENNAVKALKDIRNDMAHNSNKKISAQNYSQQVEKFKANLVVLGMTTESIEKLIERAGVTSSLKALELVKLKHVEAEKHFQSGQHQQALELYHEAITIPSLLPVNHATAFEKLAECYLNIMEATQFDTSVAEKAMLNVKQALDLNDSSWVAKYLAAKSYRWLENYTEAIAYYNEALTISPVQKNVKLELESCKLLAGVHERHEYLSPYMRLTLNEYVHQLEEKTGKTTTTEEWIQEKLAEKTMIKGSDHVFRGHENYFGWGTDQNFTEAARFYAKAASLKNPDGMFSYALCHQHGRGVKQDLVEAIRVYRQVAEMDTQNREKSSTQITVPCGVVQAQHAMARLYDRGNVAQHSLPVAAKWYKKAMENGLGCAATNLGILHYQGFGVPQDHKLAEEYWKRGLMLEDENAASSLFMFYVDQLEPEKAAEAYETGKSLGNTGLINLSELEISKVFEKIKAQRNELEPRVLIFETENNIQARELTFKQRLIRMNLNFTRNIAKVRKIEAVFEITSNDAEFTTLDVILATEHRAVLGSDIATRVLQTLTALVELDDLLQCNDARLFTNKEKVMELLSTLVNLKQFHLFKLSDSSFSKLNNLLDDGVLKAESNLSEQTHDNLKFFLFVCQQNNSASSEISTHDANTNYFLFNFPLLKCFQHITGSKPVESHFKNLRATTAYQEYLNTTAYEGIHVPLAFYELCRLYKQEHEEGGYSIEKELEFAESFYKYGQEAELYRKNCYLPYVLYNDKDQLKHDLKELKEKAQNVLNSQNESENHSNALMTRINLKDPTRVETIVAFRKSSAKKKGRKSLSSAPTLVQEVPKTLVGIQPITIKEMDNTHDKIYENTVLDLAIREDPDTTFSYITLIAEDDNGDIVKIYLYKMEKDKETLEMLSFGRRIAIINPYVMAGALQNTLEIRNDEPKCLVFLEKMEKMCRFCGIENAQLNCAKCMRQYCSENCQMLDEELLQYVHACK